MGSTIKVDTIETVAGSGNITLNNNVASLTSSGTAVQLLRFSKWCSINSE